MKPATLLKNNRTALFVVGLLLVFFLAGYFLMGQTSFVRTTLSGLTIGSLYFMVAAGLTLIFGLMDVLNFAQGTMFMIGAYLGWQFYTNPTFLFGIAPLVTAVMCGLATASILRPVVMRWQISEAWQGRLRVILTLAAIGIGVLALVGFDFLALSKTAMVATTDAAPLAEAKPQELLADFWWRPVLLILAGVIGAIGNARPGDIAQTVHHGDEKWGWITAGFLLALTVLLTLGREAGPVAVLLMDGNIRFFLALVCSALIGAGLGAVVEVSLIRPLYIRPIYQVLVTLGLAYVLRELAMLLWQPVAYQMVRPPMFAQPGEADSIWAWFAGGNSTVNIIGVTFPSYRLFIIFLGVLMLVVLSIAIGYSRLGMIIRAGVQDREMVEALGINVRRVFTIVFMIGAGLAALGGIGAAPFIPVEPGMGDVFLLQAFIVVVIGGMGSFTGAAIGALLIGLARAFGDYLALSFNLTPAIAEASTVIIMAVVLLVRPAGLFGRKE
jgi:branched-chain amino acid transport system permease protein